MVIVDQLRISDNGNQLFLDAHVNRAIDSNGDIFIKEIVIKTADMISETACELFEGDNIYKLELEEDVKEISLVLSPNDFNLQFKKNTLTEDLFFVSIKAEGTPSDKAPCRCDEAITTAVTFDENLLYQKVMGYTKELAKNCIAPSKDFVDFILLWNAFKASVETEHYISAIRFYKMLFSEISSINYTKACGCHG